jgi:putative endonuclease
MDYSPKRPWLRRWFGTRAERAAWRYLKTKGHGYITRNWSCALGEIDLVTREGSTLVFTEVRSTEGPTTELPGASVDHEKQQRLSRLALAFLQKHRLTNVAARFDVVLVSWPPGKKEPHVEHHANAFQVRGEFQLFS